MKYGENMWCFTFHTSRFYENNVSFWTEIFALLRRYAVQIGIYLTDVSGQSIGFAFKGQTVKIELFLYYLTFGRWDR